MFNRKHRHVEPIFLSELSVSWRLDSLKSPAKSRIFYIGGSEKELEDSAVMSLIFGQPSCHESVVYMKVRFSVVPKILNNAVQAFLRAQ